MANLAHRTRSTMLPVHDDGIARERLVSMSSSCKEVRLLQGPGTCLFNVVETL